MMKSTRHGRGKMVEERQTARFEYLNLEIHRGRSAGLHFLSKFQSSEITRLILSFSLLSTALFNGNITFSFLFFLSSFSAACSLPEAKLSSPPPTLSPQQPPLPRLRRRSLLRCSEPPLPSAVMTDSVAH